MQKECSLAREHIAASRPRPPKVGTKPNRRSDDMDIGRVQAAKLHILQRNGILRIMRDYNV